LNAERSLQSRKESFLYPDYEHTGLTEQLWRWVCSPCIEHVTHTYIQYFHNSLTIYGLVPFIAALGSGDWILCISCSCRTWLVQIFWIKQFE